MAIVDEGETYRGRFEVRDSAGVLADATTVTVNVIRMSDGSSAPVTPAHPAVGWYDIDYLPPAVGQYVVTASATGGPALGATVIVWSDVFDVDSLVGSFVSVGEALAHLRAVGLITTTPDIEQLRWLCSVASAAVEGDLGIEIARRTIIELHDGGSYVIIFRHGPVLSITSIVDSGVTLVPVVDYFVAGIALYRGTPLALRDFGLGAGQVVVTLVCGYADPPRLARKIALDIVASMWQASQQLPHPALDSAEQPSADLAALTAIGRLTPMERVAYQALKVTV